MLFNTLKLVSFAGQAMQAVAGVKTVLQAEYLSCKPPLALQPATSCDDWLNSQLFYIHVIT